MDCANATDDFLYEKYNRSKPKPPSKPRSKLPSKRLSKGENPATTSFHLEKRAIAKAHAALKKKLSTPGISPAQKQSLENDICLLSSRAHQLYKNHNQPKPKAPIDKKVD